MDQGGSEMTMLGTRSDRQASVDRVSAPRVATGLVLGIWAIFFWFLLISGRENLYLSTRTQWVVPVGAVLLTAASAGKLLFTKVASAEALSRRELWVMAGVCLPAVVLLVLPPATLGSGSTSNHSLFNGSQYASGIGSGPITLIDVASAETSKDGLVALQRRGGQTVDLIGFVVRYPDTPVDELYLTRYIITCCVADATVAQVHVVNVPPGKFSTNEWIDVRGSIIPLSPSEIFVDAQTITQVPTPAHPYITP
jgi:putative membrane protein